MNNMGVDIFTQPTQSEQGFPVVVNNRNRPATRDPYDEYYHNQDQYMGNSVGRQPERGPEDPFNRNNHEIFDDILPGENDFAGPFDYEGEGVLNDHFMGADLIPRRAPVSPRFQGYQAQDLFLLQPHREESNDESLRSNGDINGDEDGDNNGDDDDNDDNNNDIYVQPERSDHGGNPIIVSLSTWFVEFWCLE